MNGRKKSLKILQGILSILPLVACIPAKACTPPDTACDVIKLTDGKLIYAKVKDIEQKIIRYTGCGTNTGDSMRIILSSSVARVTYPNGEYTRVSEPAPPTADKQKWKPIFHIGINGGISIPVLTYASSSFNQNDPEWPDYGGCASSGYTGSALLSVELKHNLELTVIGNYIHNGFDANGFLQEDYKELWAQTGGQYPYNPNATGNYYLNNYGIFAGLSSHYNLKGPLSVGWHFLIGGYFVNYPAIYATVDTGQKTEGPMHVSLPAQQSTVFPVFDLGLKLGVSISPSLAIFLNADYFSTILFHGDTPYSTNTINVVNSTFGIQYTIGQNKKM